MAKSDAGAHARMLVIPCDRCLRELSIPKLDQKLRITCPSCHHQFLYRYGAWRVSGSTRRYALAGFVGGFVGFIAVEILMASLAQTAFKAPLVSAAYGIAVASALGMTAGYFRKSRPQLLYGLRTGAILGAVAGFVAGFIAQAIFSAMLAPYSPASPPPFSTQVVSRILAWLVFGLLLGAAYGVKENTRGDVKFGLLGGAVGGALGGLIFDPVAALLPSGDGTSSRLIGFSILGVAIAVSVHRFRELALTRGRPEMYQQLSRRLPANPRLGLPAAGRTS